MPKSEKESAVVLLIALVCLVVAFAAPNGVMTALLLLIALVCGVVGVLGYLKAPRQRERSK
jgi:membrane protein implicated in regulation of membrane protease activity